jgi:hypothetical protein
MSAELRGSADIGGAAPVRTSDEAIGQALCGVAPPARPFC